MAESGWKEFLKISLLPQHTNVHGTIFGGVIMSYLDQAGAHCARDGFDNRFVTVFVDGLSFSTRCTWGTWSPFAGSSSATGRPR